MLKERCEKTRVDATCVIDKLRSYVGNHILCPQMRTQTWLIADVACDYRGLHFFFLRKFKEKSVFR